MSSARIYPFPKSARRRLVPPAPVSAFFYLSGAASVARHDARYLALLVAVWGLYFFHVPLVRTRLGPLLVLAGRLLRIASAVGFFGGIYYLILTHE